MDPYFSHKIKSFMKRFYLANQAIWENTTQADEETMVFDAQSVERLRSLGYVK